MIKGPSDEASGERTCNSPDTTELLNEHLVILDVQYRSTVT